MINNPKSKHWTIKFQNYNGDVYVFLKPKGIYKCFVCNKEVTEMLFEMLVRKEIGEIEMIDNEHFCGAYCVEKQLIKEQNEKNEKQIDLGELINDNL